MNHPEHKLQCAVVKHIRSKYPQVLICASIAGRVKMTKMQLIRAYFAGYQKGFPDLMLYLPKGGAPGMAIEFKSPTGRMTPEQDSVMDYLMQQGWVTACFNDYGDAIESIDEYISRKQQ